MRGFKKRLREPDLYLRRFERVDRRRFFAIAVRCAAAEGMRACCGQAAGKRAEYKQVSFLRFDENSDRAEFYNCRGEADFRAGARGNC